MKILDRIGSNKDDILQGITAIADTSILIDVLNQEHREEVKRFLMKAAEAKAVDKNNIHEVVAIISNLMQAMEIDYSLD